MTMQQVTGTDKTLKECLDDGTIQPPGLISWNDWQVWRSGNGKRPTQETDGTVLDNRAEASLWSSTMADAHGSEWRTDLALAESEREARAR